MTFQNDLIKHQILVQRLSGSYEKIITDMMSLVEIIVNGALDKNGKLWSPALYIQLQDSLNRLEPGLINSTVENLGELVAYEDKFISKQLTKHYHIPDSGKKVNPTKVISSNMTVISGKNKKSVPMAYKLFYRHKVTKIVQGIKDSQIRSEGLEETKSFVKKLMVGLVRTQASTLALTTVNHVVAKTRTEAYRNGGIPQVMWVSLLDDSVCDDCEALDGQVFDIADAPDPPEHWNCRCHLEPVL